jgi:hypothetical protein
VVPLVDHSVLELGEAARHPMRPIRTSAVRCLRADADCMHCRDLHIYRRVDRADSPARLQDFGTASRLPYPVYDACEADVSRSFETASSIACRACRLRVMRRGTRSVLPVM